jgi:hypothetical protein
MNLHSAPAAQRFGDESHFFEDEIFFRADRSPPGPAEDRRGDLIGFP